MKKSILMSALVCSAASCAAETMNVSICILGPIPATVVERAKSETSAIFRSADVKVVWQKCGSGPRAEVAARERRFTIRLRTDSAAQTTGTTSLDAMGFTYLSVLDAGYLADAYYRTVELVAAEKNSDKAVLLGCVMAHELGHLLLGPGHVPNGIMRTAWTQRDFDAIATGGMKFGAAQRASIRRALIH